MLVMMIFDINPFYPKTERVLDVFVEKYSDCYEDVFSDTVTHRYIHCQFVARDGLRSGLIHIELEDGKPATPGAWHKILVWSRLSSMNFGEYIGRMQSGPFKMKKAEFGSGWVKDES
jgi:hypothetical protein